MTTEQREKYTAEEMEAEKMVAEEMLAGSVNTARVNYDYYASENDSDLPGVQEAINNAAQGESVFIMPGGHDTASAVGTVTVDTRLHIHFAGYIIGPDAGGGAGLVFDAACQVTSSMPAADDPPRNQHPVCVYKGDPGIVYHEPVHGGPIGAYFPQGHGHHLLQDTADNGTNGMKATLWTREVAGDGVRIENTSGSGDNLNAMKLTITNVAAVSGSPSIGVNHIDGRENEIIITNPATVDRIIKCDTLRNWYTILNNEVNTGNELEFGANSRYNYVKATRTVGKNSDSGTYNTVQGNTRVPHRSIGGGVAPGDISSNELAYDESESAIVWSEDDGTTRSVPSTVRTATGTLSVSAGGQSEIVATGFGTHLIVDTWIDADPGAAAEIRTFQEADSANGVRTWEVEELLGNTSVDVGYAVYEREGSL